MRALVAIAVALLAAPAVTAQSVPVDVGGVADPLLRPCQGPVDFGCVWAWGDLCAVYVEDPAGGALCVYPIPFEDLGNLFQCLQGPHPYMCLKI
jgi:hypothetical protein